MSDSEGAPSTPAATSAGPSSDTLQLIPKLLWFSFAVVVFTLSYKPVLDQLKSGEVAKVSFATFQIEFAQSEFSKAAGRVGQAGQSPPKEFVYFADRIQRNAEKLTGARGLWIDDKNPSQNFPERRALTSLGVSFDLARSTSEAQDLFDAADAMNSPYDFVITDIGRDPNVDPIRAPCFPFPGGPVEAGCKTIRVVAGRYPNHHVPVIIYSSDGDKYGTPSGTLGATGRMDELISLVLDAVERRQPRTNQPLAE